MSPDPTELFRRYPGNPILTPNDWPRPVNSVFNPGACICDGRTVLLCRVEDTRGVSSLWAARSDDGYKDWVVDPEPLMSPDRGAESEQWGLEDPRVVWVAELDRWVITATAYGPPGPAVFLATTDFRTVERHGLIMPPEDKNAAVFPRRIGGEWLLMHRPVAAQFGPKADIWLSRSQDLEAWRTPERVMRPRQGSLWDATRIGLGPPPIETEHGWLLIYHGVHSTVSGPIYRVGLALLDRDEPNRVIRRGTSWVLSPTEPYERTGDVPNVIFPCGTTHDPATDELKLYYGAADTVIAVATALLSEVADYLMTCPPDEA